MDCCKDPKAITGQVVCPKPRRAGPSVVVPLRSRLRDDAESKPGSELLGLILKDDFQRSVSPPFFFGSPPCRASNPLVQDARFGIDPNKLSSIRNSPDESAHHAREQLGKEQAAVRIEGFDCPNTRAVAMV
ncbi:Unknown protein [Striga hermonthica]|uniref:Uncharacterized protein n=1 Tax=Striga hermonthica TaxID=68872 RepID=A0A9N7NZS8_STRHE|nr:Unknown protein [Striga hermonthica]